MEMSAFPSGYKEIVCKQVSFRAARGNWMHLDPNFSILTGHKAHGVCVCLCVCVRERERCGREGGREGGRRRGGEGGESWWMVTLNIDDWAKARSVRSSQAMDAVWRGGR